MYWLFFAVTSVVYLLLNWIFSVNFVWNYDDVFICVESFISYKKGEISIWEYLTTFTNDHPTLIERALNYVAYTLTGQINVKLILLFSSLFPVMLSYLITKNETNYLKRYLSHCLLLSFTNSIFLWVSASAIYFFPFFFFAIIVLFFLHSDYNHIKIIPFSVCLFLMFYSFSNSLAAIPILSLYFILQLKRDGMTQRLTYAIPFIIIGTLFVIDFYYTTNYSERSGIAENTALFETIFGLIKGVGFILVFCGSFAKYFSFSPDYQIVIAMIFGTVLLFLLIRHFYKNVSNPKPWFYMGLFAFGSGLLVMIGRFDGLDYYYALDNRYEWYGVIAALSVFQLIAPTIDQFKLRSIAGIFLLTVFALTGLKTGWNTLNLPRYKKLHFNRAINFMNGSTYDIPFKTEKRRNDALKVKPIMLEAADMGLFKINPEIYVNPQ